MAKLSWDLDTRSIQNGMAAVRLRINHKSTSCFIRTGVCVEPIYFNRERMNDPINRKAIGYADKRETLSVILRKFECALYDISKEPGAIDHMTANDIRDTVIGTRTRTHAGRAGIVRSVRARDDDYMATLLEYGRCRKADKTRKSYEYVWNVLRLYNESRMLHTLTFDDLTYDRLKDIHDYMVATGKGDSTRHLVESYMRAVYREAQRMGKVGMANDPYRLYRIDRVPIHDIDALTIDQLRILASYDFGKATYQAYARDIAMASFYLCGVNLMDMYSMLAPHEDEVVYVRHKVERTNQRAMHIHIEPELRDILNRVGGSDHLFNFKEKYSTYESFQRRITRVLAESSSKLGFTVTLAKIRRSWVTVAASLDISERVINKSTGHVDSTITQKHYEQYDWGRTARANRMVIDTITKR